MDLGNTNILGTLLLSGEPILQQLAKAWGGFNGTGTVALNDSFNITSITDNGVGDYTVNLANSMNGTDYTVLATSAKVGDAAVANHLNKAAGSFDININNVGDVPVDSSDVDFLVFGDQ